MGQSQGWPQNAPLPHMPPPSITRSLYETQGGDVDQVSEWKLWTGDPPEYSTPAWYAERERAAHLENGGGDTARLQMAASWINAISPATVVDLGAGDGGLLSLIDPGIACWGYDLQPSNVAGAKERGVEVVLADVLNDAIGWGELAVATEMLEHLVDPHGFVRDIESSILIASSPMMETDQNHYEFHLWAWDMDGYRRLLEQGGYQIVRHEPIGGTICQLILGVRP